MATRNIPAEQHAALLALALWVEAAPVPLTDSQLDVVSEHESDIFLAAECEGLFMARVEDGKLLCEDGQGDEVELVAAQ